MRVLVAGATGAIGRQLVPLLSAVGHDVIGLARSADRALELETTTSRVIVADALDFSALNRAVKNASPDAVVNVLSAIPSQINPRRLARDFAMTNRLRTEGTRNLLAAAQGVDTSRFIAAGLAYGYDPRGTGLANEDAALWHNPPKQFAPVLRALIEMEGLTEQANGLVLRFGHLYGPGTIYASDGSFTRQVRAGKVPVVGGGTSTFSFTHVHDAASAIVAALERNTVGTLNIVDDLPTQLRVWLPAFAQVLDAKAPKAAPAALARMAVGGWGVAFMTQLRGADNARARLALDWRPRFPTWREGFAELGSGDVRI